MIGQSIAWRLAKEGVRVALLERRRAGDAIGTASEAAGGMLAPSAELQFEEVDFYELQRESARRWPAFAQELFQASGVDVGYRAEGTLLVGADRDAAAYYRRLYRFQKEQGVAVEWLTPDEAHDLEPFLSPRIAGAIFARDDHQVDNRAVLIALREGLRQSSHVSFEEGVHVQRVEPDPERPAVVAADGRRREARVVVLAAGAWAAALEGLPAPLPIRPVKGQLLELAMERPFGLRHVIRMPRGYLVPRACGRLVIGATSEEMGFDTRVTAGAVYRLLEQAVEVVPGVEELPLVEMWAGLRPASRDHRPLLGFGYAPGVAVATGHFRHGILLAPVTADELSREIAARLRGSACRSEWLAPFTPERFAGVGGTQAG